MLVGMTMLMGKDVNDADGDDDAENVLMEMH